MTDLLTRLNIALAGMYRIERELGRGGLATISLAHHLKHHRQVAIRVHAERAATLGSERSQRELSGSGSTLWAHGSARATAPCVAYPEDGGA